MSVFEILILLLFVGPLTVAYVLMMVLLWWAIRVLVLDE